MISEYKLSFLPWFQYKTFLVVFPYLVDYLFLISPNPFFSFSFFIYIYLFLFFIFLFFFAMDLQVFPIPMPPPTSLSTRSLWVFPEHQVWALVS